MMAKVLDDDLKSINETLFTLQQSSMRAVPVFFLGLLATLVAAAVAVYFILDLQSKLNDAQNELHDTQLALAQAQRTLADANATLKLAQSGAKSSANAERIETAINQVSHSETVLKGASTSLNQAAQKLPDAPPPAPIDGSDLLGALRFKEGPPTGTSVGGNAVYRVTIYLDLSPNLKRSTRSVRYYFHHPDWKNPKRGGSASSGYAASWNGWGCIDNADVVATLTDGREVTANFSLCDLWAKGRL